jgi:prepilin-type N-terminal cleavage/methylation domain-containing protein
LGQREGGFTLIELVVTVTILPIVIGGIAVALVSVFSIQGNVGSRLSDSDDAQIVSAYFVKDVESASMLTTSVAEACGSGHNQLLGLEWNGQANTSGNGSTYQSVASYVSVQEGNGKYSLVRDYCGAGASTNPTSSTTVSYDISSTQLSPMISATAPCDSGGPTGWTVTWVTTSCITAVTFNLNEPESSYTYTLQAIPKPGAAAGEQGSSAAVTSNSCGFATPGTGTYASTLCFIDFTPWNTQTPASGVSCQGATSGALPMDEGIPGTEFTISFCVSVSTTGGTSPCGSNTGQCGPYTFEGNTRYAWNGVSAVGLPTYYSPPTSAAFLGNYGFYTGVPGAPAFYEANEGTVSTITITNIQVLSPTGVPATDWQLITGDAESTDSGESIVWSTAGATGQPPLYDLQNSTSSAYGNACVDVNSQNQDIGVLGLGTDQVTCQANVSSDKTGTMMLQSAQPSALTVTLTGTGLQAMFMGLLLP